MTNDSDPEADTVADPNTATDPDTAGEPDTATEPRIPFKPEWFRFGLLLAVLNLAFLAVLVVLLQWNVLVGIAFAIVGGIVGTVFVHIVSSRL